MGDEDFDVGGGFDDADDMEDLMEDDVIDVEEAAEDEPTTATDAADATSSTAEPARKRAKRGPVESSGAVDLLDAIPAIEGEELWHRPAMPNLNPSTTALHLQNFEADYVAHTHCTHTYTSASLRLPRALTHTASHPASLCCLQTIAASRNFPGYPGQFDGAGGGSEHRRAIVRLFGVTPSGTSVLCHIHNFLSYFYIPTWSTFNPATDLSVLGDALNSELKGQRGSDKAASGVSRPILGLEVVQKQSLWGYHFQSAAPFIKVIVGIPALVATARRVCERGLTMGGRLGTKQFHTYESNIPFVLRFMVDKGLSGGGWLTLPAGSYEVRSDAAMVSRCQLEVDVDYRAVEAHESEGEWINVAPLRLMSVDIECAGRKGHFPQAEHDSVIQIACCISTSRNIDEPFLRTVFTLHSCAPIVGAQVVACKSEPELLLSFLRYFLITDPDLITGYNIINFDFPYLLDRAKSLKLASFPYLGRLRHGMTTMKNKKFESRAYGIRENKEIKIDGRIQFDVLDVIRREYKLRSYTLNSVCAHFLNQQKEDVRARTSDTHVHCSPYCHPHARVSPLLCCCMPCAVQVHHSIISDLQNGNAETRRRLAAYCLKDALLPLRLMGKLMLFINAIEMARVTGVPIVYLLTRGQQIKVVSQLYRKARQHDLLIPVRDQKGNDEKYEGATVIEPKKAYYLNPIATLDFASLYPSIMMAHNLCYSTLIAPADVSKLQPGEFIKTPTGDHFATPVRRKGVLPEILVELLEARARAKREMKLAADPFVQAVLNGRQLALKISAKSATPPPHRSTPRWPPPVCPFPHHVSRPSHCLCVLLSVPCTASPARRLGSCPVFPSALQ